MGAPYADPLDRFNAGESYIIFGRSTVDGGALGEFRAADGAENDMLSFALDVAGRVGIAGAPTHHVNVANDGAAYLFDACNGAERFKLTPAVLGNFQVPCPE